MSNPPIVIWGVGTTRTLRAHWMAHELGLDYETRRIESRTGETQQATYREINPREKIPTLVHGDVVVSESYAIMRYLRNLAGTLPFDDYQQSLAGQARHDEWASMLLMELDATSLYVVRRHRDLPHIYGEAPAAVESSLRYFDKMFASIANDIPASGFVWGSTFSEIDILVTIAIDWASLLGLSMPDNAISYRDEIHERDAFRAARKHNFRDLQLPMGNPRSN